MNDNIRANATPSAEADRKCTYLAKMTWIAVAAVIGRRSHVAHIASFGFCGEFSLSCWVCKMWKVTPYDQFEFQMCKCIWNTRERAKRNERIPDIHVVCGTAHSKFKPIQSLATDEHDNDAFALPPKSSCQLVNQLNSSASLTVYSSHVFVHFIVIYVFLRMNKSVFLADVSVLAHSPLASARINE